MDSLYDHLLMWQYAVCSHDTTAEMKNALLVYAEGAEVEAVRPFLRGQRDFTLAFAYYHKGDYKQAERLFRGFLASPLGQDDRHLAEQSYRSLLRIDTTTRNLAATERDYYKLFELDSANFSTTQIRQAELLQVQYELGKRKKTFCCCRHKRVCKITNSAKRPLSVASPSLASFCCSLYRAYCITATA